MFLVLPFWCWLTRWSQTKSKRAVKWLCMCVQYQKRKEAERLLEEDERRLRKEMNAKRAREEAEKLREVDSLCFLSDC